MEMRDARIRLSDLVLVSWLHLSSHMKTSALLASCSVVGLSLLSAAFPATARAEERVVVREEVREDEPRVYPVELEPHFAFGPENVYGGNGIGGGLRASIPLAWGHIGRIPQNIAISFGGDILHYDNCYYGTNCGANYLLAPVAAQWNVRVARRVSLFVEGGLFVYKGWFDGCRPGDGPSCDAPSDFGILPTVALGARVHIHDNVSFIARVGYPTTTLGISFL